MEYCEIMLENVKVFVSDKYWKQILVDLGADVVDSPNVADFVFDDVVINTPISIPYLKNIISNHFNNMDIIHNVFGRDVILPWLQHKIVVFLYKNPGVSMADVKQALGISPDITSHVVENAIYQLRKIYGHAFIQNLNGKYKIGHL